MKTITLFGFIALALTAGPALAGDNNFETTAEGIAAKLAQPSFLTRKAGDARPKTRSLGGMMATPVQKTRSLKRVRKQGGRNVQETVQVPVERQGGFVNLKIEFDVNAAAIRHDSISLLDQLGKALNSPGVVGKTVIINGHTDADGSDDLNLSLSLKRATSVKLYLVSNHGISSDRLRVMGYGEGMPLASNDSTANKQMNRRVEVVANP